MAPLPPPTAQQEPKSPDRIGPTARAWIVVMSGVVAFVAVFAARREVDSRGELVYTGGDLFGWLMVGGAAAGLAFLLVTAINQRR